MKKFSLLRAETQGKFTGESLLQDHSRFILLYCAVAVLLYLGYGINAAVQGNILITVIDFMAFLITLATGIYILRTERTRLPSLVLVITFGVALYIFFTTGGIKEMGGYFLFLFPLISMLMLGMRKGTILSSALLLLLLLSNLFPDGFPLSPPYSAGIQIRITIVYLLIYFFTIAYSYFNQDLIKKLQDALNEVRLTKKSKDQFISSLSHQIRTPLNNIVVLGNILNDSKLGEKQNDLVDTLVASANNLVAIVDNIAKVSSIEKAEEGKSDLVFNLQSSIENTVDFLTRRENKDINFGISISENIPRIIRGNPIRLKQIVLNILETLFTLRKSADAPTRLLITAARETDIDLVIQFEIITREVLDVDITQPGHGTDDKRMLRKGEFLLARKLIYDSEGKFHIAHEQEGTRISFSLPFIKVPVAAEAVEKDTTLNRIRKAQTEKRIELKDSNILLVEDNLINQKIVILSLKKFVKNIDVAIDGKEALDKFGTSKYDLILMDIQMPTMDGLIATRKIRELEMSTESHIPIIAITANALLGDKETCLSAGMDEYISKPFQIEDLVNKMSSLLAGNRPS